MTTIKRPLARSIIVLAAMLMCTFPFGVLAVAGSANTTGGGAGSLNTGSNVQLVNPLGKGASSLPALVAEIMQFVVRIGAIVVVFMLVYTGYKFVMARGNPSKIGEAQESLKWVVIGALILLGAQAIATGIQATVQALSVGS